MKATTGLAIQPAVLHGPWGFEAQLESQQMTNPKGDDQISFAVFSVVMVFNAEVIKLFSAVFIHLQKCDLFQVHNVCVKLIH